MPDYVHNYALPCQWYEKYGIRRYGFHGTSLLYVAKEQLFSWVKIPLSVT